MFACDQIVIRFVTLQSVAMRGYIL